MHGEERKREKERTEKVCVNNGQLRLQVPPLVAQIQRLDQYSMDYGWSKRPWPNTGQKKQRKNTCRWLQILKIVSFFTYSFYLDQNRLANRKSTSWVPPTFWPARLVNTTKGGTRESCAPTMTTNTSCLDKNFCEYAWFWSRCLYWPLLTLTFALLLISFFFLRSLLLTQFRDTQEADFFYGPSYFHIY